MTNLSYEENIHIEEINLEKTLNPLKAIEKFKRFQKDNVIVNSSFSDDKWKIDNEVEMIQINFEINDFSYAKIKRILQLEKEKFITTLKYFTVLRLMGNYIAGTINRFVRAMLSRFIKSKNIDSSHVKMIKQFIKFLPIKEEYKSNFLYEIEELAIYRKSQYRKIDFLSHIRFSKYLEKFWKDSDIKDKVEYYPLYLYWKITTIIPRRVTAFTITKNKCLQFENEKVLLTLLESKLKKTSSVGMKNIYLNLVCLDHLIN